MTISDEAVERLDAIEARTKGDRTDFAEGGYVAGSDVCIKDREFLLELIRPYRSQA